MSDGNVRLKQNVFGPKGAACVMIFKHAMGQVSGAGQSKLPYRPRLNYRSRVPHYERTSAMREHVQDWGRAASP